MAKTEVANYIKVTQVKSGIGRIEPQKRTIKALGLGKISSSSVLPDNPAVRGMVASVAHLVKVEAAEKPLNMSISSARRLKGKKAEAPIVAKTVEPVKAEVASSPKVQASRNDGTTTNKKPAVKKPAAKKAAPGKTTPSKEKK